MATNEKVEYGIPQVYMFEVKTDGSITKQSLTISSYANNVVTVGADITVVGIGGNVVFHQVNENNYSFGKVTGLRTIELHEDAKDYFIAPTVNIVAMSGMGVASFESAELNGDQTGITYNGQYQYNRASDYTDIDTGFTLTNVVFSADFVEYVNNAKTVNYASGKAMTVGDFDVFNDKQIKPKNLTVIALKRRTENDDKWEEFYIPRMSSGSFELPSERDAYSTLTYTFTVNTKSASSGDVFDYNVQI